MRTPRATEAMFAGDPAVGNAAPWWSGGRTEGRGGLFPGERAATGLTRWVTHAHLHTDVGGKAGQSAPQVAVTRPLRPRGLVCHPQGTG